MSLSIQLSQLDVLWCQASDLCLVLLANRSDAFFELSAAAQALRSDLHDQGVLLVRA